jgi:hypothetical protein
MARRLKVVEKDLLRLIDRSDAEIGDWKKVSDTLYPFIAKAGIPELIELRDDETGKHARLTAEGKIVLRWM